MGKYFYDYPRPAMTVDAIIFQYRQGSVNILLVKRSDAPFKDCWALPGGFVNENETVEHAVIRELAEETGLERVNLCQFYTASATGRDPRGWTVSVVFTAFVPPENMIVRAGDDAKEVMWHSIQRLPGLAFDHAEIIQKAVLYLKNRMQVGEIISELLPANYTELELSKLLEIIWQDEHQARQLIGHLRKSGLLSR
jgi:8-oxo-dGTP diphosphatase